jgi:hypothetical protein
MMQLLSYFERVSSGTCSSRRSAPELHEQQQNTSSVVGMYPCWRRLFWQLQQRYGMASSNLQQRCHRTFFENL